MDHGTGSWPTGNVNESVPSSRFNDCLAISSSPSADSDTMILLTLSCKADERILFNAPSPSSDWTYHSYVTQSRTDDVSRVFGGLLRSDRAFPQASRKLRHDTDIDLHKDGVFNDQFTLSCV